MMNDDGSEFGATYPWTRRTGETPQAYEAFRTYMNQGARRTVEGTAQELGKARSLINRWCQKWSWVERTGAYDSYLVTAQVDGEVDAFSRVRNKHLDVADKLLDHLSESMLLWKTGQDPSLRWTTAFTAAAKVQQTALTLKETLSRTDEETVTRILDIVARKAAADTE